jgi:hypothetical protein
MERPSITPDPVSFMNWGVTERYLNEFLSSLDFRREHFDNLVPASEVNTHTVLLAIDANNGDTDAATALEVDAPNFFEFLEL